MKRIILLFLAVMMFFTTSVGAVYIPQDIQNTEFEDEVELLINLGLMEYPEGGMMKPYSYMTRAEFAQLVDALLQKKAMSGIDVFIDVDREHVAWESISRLCEYGHISGDENSRFRPDDNITITDAVKILLSICGYDNIAPHYGGYPAGYMHIARDIGITKGITTEGEYINRGNAIKLLVNSFEASPVEVMLDIKQSYTVNEETTMLAEVAGIYKVREYVNANHYYALSGMIAREGCLYIGAQEMFSDPKYEDYVGFYVDCYYRETGDDTDEYEIVYLKKIENKTDYLKVYAEDIYDVENFVCTYVVDNSKLDKIKFNAETIFVYNGMPCKEFNEGMLDFANGWIEFIDTNSDGIAEIIKICEYYNVIAEKVIEDKIYIKEGVDKTIDLNKGEVKILDEEGVEISVQDIAEDDVLSVFKSGDTQDDVTTLVHSRKTVDGTISGKYEEDGITCVTINDETYIVYSERNTTETSNISLSSSGEFMLDAYGKIVSAKGKITLEYQPAYLIKVRTYDDEETCELAIHFKLSTESGVVDLMSIEKIRVDGIQYKTADFENIGRNLKTKVGQIILYKQNSTGKIVAIDTTDTNTSGMDDRLTTGPSVSASQNLRWNANTKVIEGQFPAEDDAKMFVVPSNLEEAENSQFVVKSVSNISSGTYMTGVTSYRLGDDKMPVDYLVMQGNANGLINHQSDIAIVIKESEAYNEQEEELAIRLVLNVNGTEKTLITKNKSVVEKMKYITKYSRSGDTLVDFESGMVPPLNKGDIIKYSLDDKGYIQDIAIIYSARIGMLSCNPYHNDFHEQGYRYVQGVVAEKSDEFIMLDVNNGSRSECHRIGMSPIYEVDPYVRDSFKEISISAVRVGEEVIILQTTGTPIMTLIYR